MVRKIVNVHNPALRRPAKKILKIDKKILSLIEDMKDTLKAQNDPEGVGLAAPQVGKNLQLFLIDYNGLEKIIINPKIIKLGKISEDNNQKDPLEGCLSLPHFYGPVRRAKKIKINYLNEKGIKLTEEFKGFLAHIVQHELDHLKGVIFIDRILEQDAPLFRWHNNDWEEVEI